MKALQREARGGRARERLPPGLCRSSCSSLWSKSAFSSGLQGLTNRISVWVVADGRDTCMSHAAVLPSLQSSQLIQTVALGSCHFSLFICLSSLPSPLPGPALGRLRLRGPEMHQAEFLQPLQSGWHLFACQAGPLNSFVKVQLRDHSPAPGLWRPGCWRARLRAEGVRVCLAAEGRSR